MNPDETKRFKDGFCIYQYPDQTWCANAPVGSEYCVYHQSSATPVEHGSFFQGIWNWLLRR